MDILLTDIQARLNALVTDLKSHLAQVSRPVASRYLTLDSKVFAFAIGVSPTQSNAPWFISS